MAERLLLEGGSVLVGDRFERADILVAGAGIERLLPGGAPPGGPAAGAARLDLRGSRVLPGFIDIHSHGGAGVDFNSAAAADLEKVASFYASRGVTSFLPTVLADSPEVMARQLGVLALAPERPGLPRALGVHLEGPFLSPAYKGAQPERFLRGFDLGLFQELRAAAGGRILLVTVSPELEGAPAFIEALSASGVAVSLGHSGASYDQAMAAIRAGARCATHVMNAMKLLHMHDPAILTAVLESDIYAEMICDGIHLHPPIVRLLLKAKGLDRMIAVTDSIMAAGLPDGRYRLGAHEVEVAGGDAKVAGSGARAGSTLDMAKAARNIRAFAGLGLEEVSRLVSGNAARMLGLSGLIGSIGEGMRADLVVLGPGDEVEMTIAGGAVAYSR